ncbi:hypothetical protein [Paraglaciecola sp. T6c]|uniref:hypothetical protein n=1 Tax=Pseudoalteromonas atlantica (strain T6c / ATCC BAA-1087) TaxID=3042615 RepID=UPI0002E774C5|nr:hypothetical protein [Paraglaciecola sp. T6c]
MKDTNNGPFAVGCVYSLSDLAKQNTGLSYHEKSGALRQVSELRIIQLINQVAAQP